MKDSCHSEEEQLPRKFGPALEHHNFFPNQANVEFCSLDSSSAVVRVRMWERGAGETKACGSGACAVAFAAVRRGIIKDNNNVKIIMDGGELNVSVDPDDGTVTQKGEAVFVFQGVYKL